MCTQTMVTRTSMMAKTSSVRLVSLSLVVVKEQPVELDCGWAEGEIQPATKILPTSLAAYFGPCRRRPYMEMCVETDCQ